MGDVFDNKPSFTFWERWSKLAQIGSDSLDNEQHFQFVRYRGATPGQDGTWCTLCGAQVLDDSPRSIRAHVRWHAQMALVEALAEEFIATKAEKRMAENALETARFRREIGTFTGTTQPETTH